MSARRPTHLPAPQDLTVGGVTLSLEAGGVGGVQIGDVVVRSGARPLSPEVRNPWAIQLFNLRVAAVVDAGGGYDIAFAADRVAAGPMEWMLHTVRPRYNASDWSLPPRPAEGTTLTLELRPADRCVAGVRGMGFSYRYRYASHDVPIYKILDRATWEPGGRATGNELWLRNAHAPPIHRFETADEHYSTEWYLASARNPNVFQFLPWQTQLQGFTLTCNDRGCLVTWASELRHIRSLFEKPRGQDVIAHLHEHCGDLGYSLETSPVEVLWFAGSFDRVDRANLYEGMRSHVAATLHEQAGMREERATTYGVIEEWANADLDRYRRLGLPKLAEAGVRTLFLASHFENNMNAFGVSNMCCTTDWRVPDSVGETNLARLGAEALAEGIGVEMWGNTALSSLALLEAQQNGKEGRLRRREGNGTVMHALAGAKDPFVRNPTGAIEADHYAPVFAQLNLRDPQVRRVWLERWRDAHDRLNLRGIFLDSSFNMSSDKFHWVARLDGTRHGGTADQLDLLGQQRPDPEPEAAILSQYHAHLSLMAEMQRIGYRYCGEDMGVFGVHRAGPSMATAAASLSLWCDCLADYDAAQLRDLGHDAESVFFRGLAYRLMWKLYWLPDCDALSWRYQKIASDDDRPTPAQLALLRVYNRVSPFMETRRVLPGERGVEYRGGDGIVVWAFEDFCWSPPDEDGTLTDVTGGSRVDLRPAIDLAARHVYLFEPSPDPVARRPLQEAFQP